jgi:hypothetical protein
MIFHTLVGISPLVGVSPTGMTVTEQYQRR